LFNPDPAAYLPHRYPFLMLDRLLALEPGVDGVAKRLVTTSSVFFPQVLLVECVAQLAGIVAIREQGEGGFLASIDHAEFEGTICEGDSLLITARILKTFGRLILIAGDVACEDRYLLRAQMTLGVGML
jgi:3-hydroxyacyl-[acyl-carrier-protein] dehydratase